MMPGDPVIVRGLKATVLDSLADRLVEIADQPAIEREPGQDRKVALGDAEGQSDLGGTAPLGDDPALVKDEPVRAAARPHRSERLIPRRLFAKIGGDHLRQIPTPWRLMLGRVPRGSVDRGRLKTGRI